MKVTILLFISFLCLSSKSLTPHVHGELNLSAVIDGKEVFFMLEGSSEAIYGFEHRPKNKKEKAKVLAANSLWKSNFSNLIVMDKSLGCKTIKSTINSEKEEHHDDKKGHSHKKAHHKEDDHKEEESHSDFSGEAHVKCKNKIEKTKMSIRLKSFYPRIEKIKLQLVRADGTSTVKSLKRKKEDINI